MTQEYVERLVKAYPSLREIWLFGSRANRTETPRSDWDYMAFGDDAGAMHALHHDLQFNEAGVDLMFAGPGVDVEAMKPWPEPDGHWKKLGLSAAPGGIRWRILSDTEAQYTVYKDRRPGSIETDPYTLNAKLVYRRSPPL
jgi:hypothetical protein